MQTLSRLARLTSFGLAPALGLVVASAAQQPIDVLEAPGGSGGFGKKVTGLGDVNADGVGDFAVVDGIGIVRVYSGATRVLVTTLSTGTTDYLCGGLGSHDVNGDGIAEIIVGVQGSVFSSFFNMRAVEVSTGAVLWTYGDFQFVGEDEQRIETLGDQNGDGIDEILVGVPDYDFWHPASWESGAIVLDGATGEILVRAIQDVETMGEGVADIGDLDQDGVADIVVGTPSFANFSLQATTPRGRVQALRTNILGATTFPWPSVLWSVEGSHDNAGLGEAIAAIGDRNGDGVTDILTLETLETGPTPDSKDMRLIIMSGADGATLHSRLLLGEGAYGNAHEPEFTAVGDYDGDGLSEVAMYTPRASRAAGGLESPVLRVLSAQTLGTFQSWIGDDLGFGAADPELVEISSVGDLDADGVPELLVAVPTPAAGRVLILQGMPPVAPRGCGAAVANSTGAIARLHAVGSDFVSANHLRLVASELPPSTFVLPIASMSAGSYPMTGGDGTLCLSGNILRLNTLVDQASVAGTLSVGVDIVEWNQISPSGISPGDTWFFQLWFRDVNANGQTSNLSNTRAVTFR